MLQIAVTRGRSPTGTLAMRISIAEAKSGYRYETFRYIAWIDPSTSKLSYELANDDYMHDYHPDHYELIHTTWRYFTEHFSETNTAAFTISKG